MSSTRIPSPARSQGVISTPRQRKHRASRSVGSPARSTTSVKLSTIVQENQMDSFVLSPLRTRRSVLSDNTDIEIPRRKSWWKKLDENSKDVMEFIENREQEQAINVEEFIDTEILSQEKKNYTIDLPESSDGESITSIVLPQRKLFKQKDQAQKVYRNIMDNRENLDQLQRSKINYDNTIHVRKKDLFNRGNKERSKPAFPAALLNISTDKTLMSKKDKDKDISKQGQMRNLFGNRPGTKRKNMFAEFVVSESEDEISDIQAKVFGFAKNSEPNRLRASASERVRETSPTSDVTDIEIDDWKLLPSSTMVENQFGNVESNTPVKKAKLSQLSKNAEIDRSKVDDIGNKSKQTHKSVANSKNLSKSSKFSTRNVEDFFESPLSDRDEIDEDVTLTEQNKIDNNRKIITENSRSLKIQDIVTDKLIKDVTTKNNQVENYAQDMEIKKSIKNVTTNNKIGDDGQSIEIDKSTKDMTSTNNKENKDEQVMEIDKTIKDVTTNNNEVVNEEPVMEIDKSIKDMPTDNNKVDNVEQDMEIDKTIKDVSTNNNNVDNDEQDMEMDKCIKDVTTNNNEVDNDDDNNDFTLQYDSDEGNNNPENLNDENDGTLKQLETTNKVIEKDESTLKDDTRSKYNMTDNKKRSMREAPNNNTLISSPTEPIKERSIIAINEQRPSLEPLRESTRLSDGTKGSSIERSGWDSHRTTRKTLRQTFGKDFTPRKSLRALVMEKSAKRQTYGFDVTTKMPQACSTRLPENMHMDSVRDNDATHNDVIEPQHKSDVRVEEDLKMSETKTVEDQNRGTNEENVISNNSNRKNTSKHSTIDTLIGLPQTNDDVEENLEETVDKFKHNYRSEGNDKGQRGFRDVLEKGIHEERMESLDIEKEGRHSQDVSGGEIDRDKRIDFQVVGDEESDEEIRGSRDDQDGKVDEEKEDSQDMQKEESNGERSDSEHVQEEEIDEDGTESEDIQDDVESDEERRDSLRNESEERRDSYDNAMSQTDVDEAEEDDEQKRDSFNIQNSLNNDNAEEINDQIEDIQEGEESDEESAVSQNDENEESDEEMRNSEDNEQEESEKENIVSRNSEIDASQPRFFMNHSTREQSSNMTEESDHEVSRMRRQNALEMYLQKVKQQNLEKRRQAEEAVRNSLKAQPRERFDDFKVPLRPITSLRRSKPAAARPKPAKTVKSTILGVENLPSEVLEDLKYKPPRRYQPSNASWITKRLYKFLETKLEPKYDYKARVRAEKLAESLYEFAKEARRRNVADPDAVDALKLEMARLDVVATHFEFYQFFHDFMPREIRVKVVPDVVNKISLPKHGIFSNIIR